MPRISKGEETECTKGSGEINIWPQLILVGRNGLHFKCLHVALLPFSEHVLMQGQAHGEIEQHTQKMGEVSVSTPTAVKMLGWTTVWR